MIKEIEIFEQTRANIDSRIKQLTTEVGQRKDQHEKAVSKYKDMMLEDSAGIKSYTTAELNKAKMRADELASEIGVAEERLQMVEAGKNEKLKTLIVDVQKGWEREIAKLNDKVTAVFEAAREHRAKLTLEIQKGHELYLQAKELLRELNQAEHIVGMNYDKRTNRLGVPEKPLVKELRDISYYSITDKCVIPHEDELIKAYQKGEVAAWIDHYAKTGEVVTNEALRKHDEKPIAKAIGGVKGVLEQVKRVIPKFGQEDIKSITIQSPDNRKAFERWKSENPDAHVVEVDGETSTQDALKIRYVPVKR
ncbi:hypothetical protein [Paenibacillus durus]|uniref:Uncharacterized protein n=1 Tax=Paenibacillus durus ATCC 35681 TaxID=1333534 RepID=A0A0F7F9T0_PAEDU|nr:hypothetical protein [Paenibacillus durus]AKG34663.1 hypothetical protein VK70_08795 [Paenibacillus durus ATCC 35681]